jgi:hypothetical protein
MTTRKSNEQENHMNRLARSSITKALNLVLVAMIVATVSSVRFGETRAYAFDPVGVPIGQTNPAHTSGGAIQCVSGSVNIRPGTLSADAMGYNTSGSINIFGYSRIDVTLWRWTAQGWMVVLDGSRLVWDLGTGQYVSPVVFDGTKYVNPSTISETVALGSYTGNPNHWMVFGQLPSGYYTIGLRFNFLDGLNWNYSLLGWSDWTPNATDFYYNHGLPYCQI